MTNVIKENEYVIIQRHNYKKYHKLTLKNMDCRLGKDTVDLNAIIGEPYWTTFKLEPKPKLKNNYQLIKCETAITFTDEILKNSSSGMDNRDIVDDGSSQKLSTEEIISLKESGLSAQSIVGTLIENSKTFASKTEYSQEKYLKKKEKKYFEHIVVLRPTLRIVSEILIGKQPNKALGLRMDTLSQLTTIACARSGGRYIIYETGCQGLVTAAFLNAIGGDGTIVHVYAGNQAEKQAIQVLNFPQETLDQVLSINIKNVLQNEVANKRKENTDNGSVELGKRKLEEREGDEDRKKFKWEENQEKALALLNERSADGLVIVGKEHPANILQTLLKFLHISRTFVVFCPVREPLQELFIDLKIRSDIAVVRLTESWLRGYQILPDRTHPEITVNASGGYLLSGMKVLS